MINKKNMSIFIYIPLINERKVLKVIKVFKYYSCALAKELHNASHTTMWHTFLFSHFRLGISSWKKPTLQKAGCLNSLDHPAGQGHCIGPSYRGVMRRDMSAGVWAPSFFSGQTCQRQLTNAAISNKTIMD